jgi:hypothetical protein
MQKKSVEADKYCLYWEKAKNLFEELNKTPEYIFLTPSSCRVIKQL